MLRHLTIRIKVFVYCVGAAVLVMSCQSEYEKLVSREMASKERQDSLFLGLRLGMSSREFFAHCWELNKKHVIRQGYSNTSVLYRINELKDTADINFYPTFDNDTIYEMKATIGYLSWAPWNKELTQDTLLTDVLTMMNRWYGGTFLQLDFDRQSSIYVKMNRNRRILVSRDGESKINVLYTDMIRDRRRPKDEQEQAKQ